MNKRRSSRIASRRARRGGAHRASPAAGGTTRCRGRPRVVRVEEEILVPPVVDPALASADESHHSDSEREVNDGISVGVPSVPSAPATERVPPATVVMNAKEFAVTIARAIRKSQSGGVAATERNREPSVMHIQRELAKLTRLVFEGGPDPLAADRCITDMEHQIRIMGVTDTFVMARVAPVTFQGEAMSWWKGKSSFLGNVELTWDELRHVFVERYFPATKRQQIREDFIRLAQGTYSVAKYSEIFISQSRFVPEMVSTEIMKVRKFYRGLRPSLQRNVIPREGHTLEEIVDMAAYQEGLEEEFGTQMNVLESRGGGSQSQGLPPKDMGRGDQRRGGNAIANFGGYRGQNRQFGTGSTGGFGNRKMVFGRFSQGSVTCHHVVRILRVEPQEFKIKDPDVGSMVSWDISGISARRIRFSIFIVRDSGIVVRNI